ncbi:MAG: SDR family oxidoreductase [Myxococcota bacterium]|nr:SDR family oxidoreductase [Myxococcota bacterium]
MSKGQLQGKVALVTGGSRGLGRAAVERLARDGATVLFTYRSQEAAAREVEEAVALEGGSAHPLQADLCTHAGVMALFGAVEERLGVGKSLDILVANAGIIQDRRLDEVREADFDAVFDLNVKGVFFTAQQAARRMRDGGRIVLLGTGLTRFAFPQYIVYGAAKGALTTLAHYLAAELGPRGITANVLAPGAIDTDMNPGLRTEQGAAHISGITALGRVGHADDIADAIAFLAGPDSRWVTAQRVEASGGMKL